MFLFSKLSLAMVALLSLVTLVGCGSTRLSNSTITNMLTDHLEGMYGEGRVVKSIDIIDHEEHDRNPDFDRMSPVMPLDVVTARVTSESEILTYVTYYQAGFFLEGSGTNTEEWFLSRIYECTQNASQVLPRAGMNETHLTNLLERNQTISIDGDNWQLGSASITIESLDILTQDTDLDVGTDRLTASILLTSEVLTAYGVLDLTLSFEDGAWRITDLFVSTPFETEFREGRELDLSETRLLEDLTSEQFSFGDRAVGDQLVTITPGEVTDFTIENVTYLDMGTRVDVEVSFVLEKELASLNLTTVLRYNFNHTEWLLSSLETTGEVGNVNLSELEGSWEGIMNHLSTIGRPEQMRLEISSISSDGSFTAIVTSPTENRESRLSGQLDKNNLTITLNFDSWVTAPNRNASIFEPNLHGLLLLDDSTLTSLPGSRTNDFEVSQAN